MPLIGTLTSGSLGAFGLAQQAQIAILKATTAIPGSVPVSADWSNVALAHTLDNPNAYGTSANDRFGFSVAIDGDYAIIGANLEDGAAGSAAGKAYIYNVTTGTLVHTLDGTSDTAYFGNSVAISGDYAIVGAWKEDTDVGSTSGKAYIYNVTTGALVHTLDNPSAFSTSTGDFFGYRVAISGDRAIIGAYGEDDAGGDSSGKAYIFDVTTGTLVHTINNPNPYGTSAYDYFGSELAISGDYAILGAYGEDDADGTYSGKAYIYNVTTGALVHIINNPSAYSSGAQDYFGGKVAISGDYAIVGAYEEDDAGGDSSGKAYIFDVTTGTLVHTLDNPNPYGTSSGDQFGMGVAISGDYAIVTATAEDDAGGTSSGKAYIYNVTSGELVKTLDNPNPYGSSTNDFFGYGVAISGDYVIVGAYGEDDAGGTTSGKAYIFSAPEAAPASAEWSIDLSNVTYVAEHNLTPPITANAFALTFSTDGTKLYVCGITQFPPRRDEVVQYSLSTAFDISTASYDNIKFNPSSQDTYPMGIAFNTDGTKMFLVGSGTHVVFQYSLSTPWDIGTASYDNLSISAGGAFGIHFNADGTKMYTIGYGSEVAGVRSFSLSTGFDLSTATDDLTSYSSIAVTGGNPFAAALNPDGTKMYILGYSNKSIYRYSLSTAFDVSTATYDNESISLDTELNTTYNMEISRDGTKIYVVGDTGSSISVLQFDTGL